MINKKALAWFLGLTFGATLIIAFTARSLGFTLIGKPDMFAQLTIAGAMFVPGISALLVQKLVAKKSLKELGFTFGPVKYYIQTYFLIVLLYAINYAIIWLFVQKPDFTLNSFMNQFTQFGANLQLPIPAWQMVLAFTGLTFIGAPIFNIIPSMGEEIGWRGFLLPNLLPLGKAKALVFSGMIWALWHTPFILLLGFSYGEHKIGALLHFAAVTCLGVWFGHLWLETKSTILATFAHAVFNANNYGIWAMVFVGYNKLLYGSIGLTSVILYLILAGALLYKTVKSRQQFAAIGN